MGWAARCLTPSVQLLHCDKKAEFNLCQHCIQPVYRTNSWWRVQGRGRTSCETANVGLSKGTERKAVHMMHSCKGFSNRISCAGQEACWKHLIHSEMQRPIWPRTWFLQLWHLNSIWSAQEIQYLSYQKIMHSVLTLSSHIVILNEHFSWIFNVFSSDNFQNVILPNKMDTVLDISVCVPIWEISSN